MSCLSDEAGHFLMTSPDLPEGEELLSTPRLYFMFSFYKNIKNTIKEIVLLPEY